MAANGITCHVPAVPAGARAELLDTQISLETALDILCTWFMQNGMMVNASKTGVGDVVCAAPRCRVVQRVPWFVLHRAAVWSDRRHSRW